MQLSTLALNDCGITHASVHRLALALACTTSALHVVQLNGNDLGDTSELAAVLGARSSTGLSIFPAPVSNDAAVAHEEWRRAASRAGFRGGDPRDDLAGSWPAKAR